MHLLSVLLLTLTLRAVAQIPTISPNPDINTPTGLRSYCYDVIDYQLACQSLTPNWTALAPTDQASCYCYDTAGKYVPTIYDNAASNCYEFIKATPTAGDLTFVMTKDVGACTRFASAPSITIFSSFDVMLGSTSSSAMITSNTQSGASTSSSSSMSPSSTSSKNAATFVTPQTRSVALGAMAFLLGILQ